jgi:hypothetical protein
MPGSGIALKAAAGGRFRFFRASGPAFPESGIPGKPEHKSDYPAPEGGVLQARIPKKMEVTE